MQSFLQSAGYSAVALSDPLRIEQMLATEHPNLILLDVVMPGRNGFQACRELKAARNSQHPDCAGEFKERRKRQVLGLQQGADGYVIKPFTGRN